jgi:hypothetical protein
MSLEKLSDDSVLILYESIRKQVAADIHSGVPQRLMGETAKQRAEQLREEMDRRRMRFKPIDWPG